mgnify:CR=1 FL=1
MIKFFRKYKIKGVYLFAFIIIGIVTLMTLFPKMFTRINPYELIDDSLLPPSAEHLFGTDEIGRDLFSRVIYGARNTMYVGLGATFFAALIGIPLGLVSGYFAGKVDLVIMRILDALMSFPAILLSVLIIAVTGANVNALVLAIAIVNFPRFARIVRSNTLYIKKNDFVEATKTFGAKTRYLMFATILRNCLSPIVVQFTLLVAVAILIEASMSFLGLGIQAPAPAWGSMLHTAQLYTRSAWWYAFVPGFFIFILVYSFNLFGDWLRDFTDPRKRTT